MQVPDIWRKEGSFGPWLKERMRQEGLTQRKLARLAEVDHSTISRLMSQPNRDPLLATALRIKEVLDGRD